MHTEKGKLFVLSVYLCPGKIATPLLSNFVIYPLYFTAYIYCDVTSQLFKSKGGGALDPKNQTYTTMLSGRKL